jgi:hypothetical protein
MKLHQIFYKSFSFHLGLRSEKMWPRGATGRTSGQHRPDRCSPETQLGQTLILSPSQRLDKRYRVDIDPYFSKS